MPYNIYLSDNPITPFLTISDDTFDTTSTSVGFIGKKSVDYGNIQQQDLLWMLENFSNGTAPGAPITGQLWYDTSQSELKLYKGSSTWRKVGVPQTGSIPPVSPDVGQFWFDTITQLLKTWTGLTWLVIGPVSILPGNQYLQYALALTTTNGTNSEMWINGNPGSRQVLDNNTTYTFEITISARRTDSGVEFAGWKINGVINQTAGALVFSGTPAITVVGNTSPWSVSVTADNTNHALGVFVTGQAGKTVNWSCVSTLYIAQ